MITRKDYTIASPVEKSYPYIGEDKYGVVVLFTAPKTGVVLLYGTTLRYLGEKDNQFREDNFIIVPELTLISK